MGLTCEACGGRLLLRPGEAVGVCRECGTKQTVDRDAVYAQASRLMETDTETDLEAAMDLFGAIRGWRDADRRYLDCRTRLGRKRWQTESVQLKAAEDRNEIRVTRWKRAAILLLAAVLLTLAVVSTVALIQYRRYNRAAEYLTAGEYGRAAAAFQDMGDFQDARARVFESAVGLYKTKRYEEALPYFVWLDGYIDNGYYLRKCRERLGLPEASAAREPGRA